MKFEAVVNIYKPNGYYYRIITTKTQKSVCVCLWNMTSCDVLIKINKYAENLSLIHREREIDKLSRSLIFTIQFAFWKTSMEISTFGSL